MNYLQKQNFIRPIVMTGDPLNKDRITRWRDEVVRRQSIQWPEWYLNANVAGVAGGNQSQNQAISQA